MMSFYLPAVKKANLPFKALDGYIIPQLNPESSVIHHCDKNIPTCQDAGRKRERRRHTDGSTFFLLSHDDEVFSLARDN